MGLGSRRTVRACVAASTRTLLSVTALLVLLVAAGCGDDDSGSNGGGSASGGESAKPAQLDVGYIEVTSAAPLMLAVEKGFFKEENLDVTPKPTEAASTIPGVVSGDLDLTFTNPPATLLAKSNGLPVKAVAPAAAAADKDAYIQLVVNKDSGIKSPADLNGKKVAVDTLFQLPHIALLRAAEAEGADPKKWDITEVPFPAMAQALKSGKVDAAFMGEPFLTQALSGDANTTILGLYDGWETDTPFSLYVTSEQFLNKNKDVVERFNRAIRKANTYAEENEAEQRKLMPTFLEMPEKVAQQIILPAFSPNLNVQGLETWKTVMDEAGVLKKDVDVSDVTSDVLTASN